MNKPGECPTQTSRSQVWPHGQVQFLPVAAYASKLTHTHTKVEMLEGSSKRLSTSRRKSTFQLRASARTPPLGKLHLMARVASSEGSRAFCFAGWCSFQNVPFRVQMAWVVETGDAMYARHFHCDCCIRTRHGNGGRADSPRALHKKKKKKLSRDVSWYCEIVSTRGPRISQRPIIA